MEELDNYIVAKLKSYRFKYLLLFIIISLPLLLSLSLIFVIVFCFFLLFLLSVHGLLAVFLTCPLQGSSLSCFVSTVLAHPLLHGHKFLMCISLSCSRHLNIVIFVLVFVIYTVSLLSTKLFLKCSMKIATVSQYKQYVAMVVACII